MKKVFATIAAGALMVTLTACGNTSNSAKNTSSRETTSSNTIKKAQTANKKAAAVAKDNKNNNSSVSSSSSETKESMDSTVTSNKNNETTAMSDSSTRSAMTAQDAKNIVKEHIGNQLNNAGIDGKQVTGLPSIDEVDGYTAVQNGVNDWIVSGNGHSFRVTATSVTGE